MPNIYLLSANVISKVSPKWTLIGFQVWMPLTSINQVFLHSLISSRYILFFENNIRETFQNLCVCFEANKMYIEEKKCRVFRIFQSLILLENISREFSKIVYLANQVFSKYRNLDFRIYYNIDLSFQILRFVVFIGFY